MRICNICCRGAYLGRKFLSSLINDLFDVFYANKGLRKSCVYIDDILIASETEAQHLEDLDAVFKTLAANGLVIRRDKCVLGKPSLEFLGYQVDEKGISPLPERVDSIRATTPPTSVKELH